MPIVTPDIPAHDFHSVRANNRQWSEVAQAATHPATPEQEREVNAGRIVSSDTGLIRTTEFNPSRLVIVGLVFSCIILVGSLCLIRLQFSGNVPANLPRTTARVQDGPQQVAPIEMTATETERPTIAPTPTIDQPATLSAKINEAVATGTQVRLNLQMTDDKNASIAANANGTATQRALDSNSMTQAAHNTLLIAAQVSQISADATATARAREIEQKREETQSKILVIFGGIAIAFLMLIGLSVLIHQWIKFRSWWRDETERRAVPELLRDMQPPSDYENENIPEVDIFIPGVTRQEAYWFLRSSPIEPRPQHGLSGHRRDVVKLMTDWIVDKKYASAPAGGNVGAKWLPGFSNGEVARKNNLPLNGKLDTPPLTD